MENIETSYINSWTESEETFKLQLKSGLQQFIIKLPEHIVSIIITLNELKDVKRVVDIGCGCGLLCYIIHKYLPNLEYIGYDYSKHAVKVATEQWGPYFQVKNYKELKKEDFKEGDILIENALADVLPNGDECIKFLLSFNLKYVLLSRVKTTNKVSYYETYSAYDIITYAYYHNYNNLLEIFNRSNYSARMTKVLPDSYNIILIKNNITNYHNLKLDQKLVDFIVANIESLEIPKNMTDPMSHEQMTYILMGEYLFKLGQYINQTSSELLSRGQWDFKTPDWYDHRHHFLDPKLQSKNNWLESVSIVLRKLKEGGKILDLCAGDAFFSKQFFSKLASEILCIDKNSDPYKKYVVNLNRDDKIKYVIESILVSNIPQNYFDIVYMRSSIEHFSREDQLKVIKIAHKALKIDGWFIGETIQVEDKTEYAPHEFEWNSEECGRKILFTQFNKINIYSLYCNIDPRTTIFWECQK